MDSIDYEPINSITGGEVFLIKWSKSKNMTINVVVPANEEEYYLVDLAKQDYWKQYETLSEEVQEEEDILEYLDFLEESGEANTKCLGRLNKEKTYQKILFVISNCPKLDWRKNKEMTISKSINKIIQDIQNLTFIRQKIQELPLKSGDVVETYSQKGQSVSRERITIFEKGYVILPTRYKIESSIEEELMSKEELLEYIFVLIADEKRNIVYDSVFCPSRTNIYLSLTEKAWDKGVAGIKH